MTHRKPSLWREFICATQRVFGGLIRIFTLENEKLIVRILVILFIILTWWFLIPMFTIQEYMSERKVYKNTKLKGGNKK